MGPNSRNIALTLLFAAVSLGLLNPAHADVCPDLRTAITSAGDVAGDQLSISYSDDGEPLEYDTTDLSPGDAAKAPTVKCDGRLPKGWRYMLVMVDPDAPSRENPKFRYWLHWLVADIDPGQLLGDGILKGRTLMKYNGPSPPKKTGFHRYQFYLFKQPSREVKLVPTDRYSFDLEKFAKKNGLCGSLVGSYQFRTQNKS